MDILHKALAHIAHLFPLHWLLLLLKMHDLENVEEKHLS